MTHNKPVTASEMRDILSELQYSQVEFSQLINVSDRNVRRLVSDDAENHDGSMIVLLRIMKILNKNPAILDKYNIKELAALSSNFTAEEILDSAWGEKS